MMKETVLLIACFSVFLKSVQAGPFSSCEVDGVTDTEWFFLGHTLKSPIDDTHDGVITTFQTKNIKAMQIEPDFNDENYLNATFENDILTIFTSEQFKNFEKERKGQYGGSTISIQFGCDCTSGSELLTIKAKVTDTNNHDPVLNEEVYKYDFAMTIPKDFDLTKFQTISAYDDDFTNNDIHFTMDSTKSSENFKIVRGSSNNQNYLASLKTTKNITAPFEEEFIIVATDVGNPKISTKASVIVSVQLPEEGASNSGEEELVHPPVFSQHVYYANYTSKNELVMDEPIVIKYGATTDMVIEQSGYKEYFKISSKGEGEEITVAVELAKPLPVELLEMDVLVIEIEALNKGSSLPGRTTLIIRLPNDNSENLVHPPVFSKHLYSAQYTTDNAIILQEPIIIKYGASNDMVVRQTGYTEYFKINPKAPGIEELTVEVIKHLTEDILEKGVIVIEIEAENKGLTIPGRTALIIHLPNTEQGVNVHPPVFSKHFYFAFYNSSSKHLTMEDTVTIKYGATNTTVVNQSDYAEYIKLNLQIPTNIVQVQLIKPLPYNIFTNNTLVIEIEARNKNLSIPGRTALIIQQSPNGKGVLQDCDITQTWGYSFSASFLPLILFTSSVLVIVFLNVIILSLYFRKQRANVNAVNETPAVNVRF